MLETLTGITGTADQHAHLRHLAYRASNTRIRFRISANYGGDDELLQGRPGAIDAACTPQTGSIGDRLWYDTDGDGAQDSGEPGLSGMTVELLNSGGTVIATKTTDSNGIYTFTSLAAGTYTVRVVDLDLPGRRPGTHLRPRRHGHRPYRRGHPQRPVRPAPTSTSATAARGPLGDRVWNDADGDGIQDAGEPGINGVTVRLFLGTTEVATHVTAGNGNYTFTNLPETTYTVRIDTATLPAGMTPTYDLDGTGSPHQATSPDRQPHRRRLRLPHPAGLLHGGLLQGPLHHRELLEQRRHSELDRRVDRVATSRGRASAAAT